MIKFCKGNIFSSECQTLVNPVNTVGVMGNGLALQFKIRYPKMYEDYRRRCLSDLFHIGDLLVYKNCPDGKWVLSFPTKVHWRYPSRYEYIESGLKEFLNIYKVVGITSIAIPKLGVGLGGLEWSKVKELMIKYLSQCEDLNIEIYE